MIGIGIIGSGAVASFHVEAYLAHTDVCLIVAVCDAVKQKAENLIQKYGLQAVAYGSVDELLSDKRVDAVSICLPPGMHCCETVKALQAQKHVLCEKPMACSLDECDRMIVAQKKSGKILSVVSQNRYKTPVAKVKMLLEQGLAGPIHYASFDSLWWRGENYYDLDWRGTWAIEGGGCFLSHSVHYLDIMHMLFGMPVRVRSSLFNVAHHNSECEDLGFAVFTFEDGMVVQFTSSLVSHGEKQSISIQGEHACMDIPWSTMASIPLANGFPVEDVRKRETMEKAYASLPSLPEEGHPAQICNFLNAIIGKGQLDIPGEEGRKTIALITGIYKSYALKQDVEFPISQDDPFYQKKTMLPLLPHFFEKKRSVSQNADIGITLGRNFGN